MTDFECVLSLSQGAHGTDVINIHWCNRSGALWAFACVCLFHFSFSSFWLWPCCSMLRARIGILWKGGTVGMQDNNLHKGPGEGPASTHTPITMSTAFPNTAERHAPSEKTSAAEHGSRIYAHMYNSGSRKPRKFKLLFHEMEIKSFMVTCTCLLQLQRGATVSHVAFVCLFT